MKEKECVDWLSDCQLLKNSVPYSLPDPEVPVINEQADGQL
jgi:hypothetical protein